MGGRLECFVGEEDAVERLEEQARQHIVILHPLLQARQHIEDVTAPELHWLVTAPHRAWLNQSYAECDEAREGKRREEERRGEERRESASYAVCDEVAASLAPPTPTPTQPTATPARLVQARRRNHGRLPCHPHPRRHRLPRSPSRSRGS